MKVLSIDVGIKNLACCLFSVVGDQVDILKWDVLNIMGAPGEDMAIAEQRASDVVQCAIIRPGKKKGAPGCPCTKAAIYMTPGKDGSPRCMAHAKKESGAIMPTADLKPSAIKRCNLTQLCELADKYQISYTRPIKKAALAAMLGDYAEATCMRPILPSESEGAAAIPPKGPNARQICMVKLGRHLKQHLDVFLEGHWVDYVAIEKQMTARMKCVQCMIAQYFIMGAGGCGAGGSQTTVAFVSATHKLEAGDTAAATAKASAVESDAIDTFIDSDDEDDIGTVSVEAIVRKMKQRTYKTRKTTGIDYCIADLQMQKVNDTWIDFMRSHKKQDDLADCYLQGRWYIQKRVG